MLVSKQHKKLLLNLKNPEKVTTLIPTARVAQVKGKDIVVVPHREDEVRVLRNIGFDAPAPMAYYYDWPGRYKPFAHQKVTGEFLSMNPHAFCLSGMGSGKTMSVLWAFDYLRKQGLVRKMLVISPLSTLERTWGDEIFRNMIDYSFAVVHGTRDKRLKLINAEYDIYIINHDGIKSADTMAAILAREDIDLVVVDEIASFRNASTDRWKALNLLVNGSEKKGIKPKEWVWGLTGTPTPNEPTDAWAQIRLVSPARVPKYFGHFRDKVMRQATQFKWLARDNAVQVVSEVMQPAIRFATEDCVDLPPTTYLTRQADLTPEQKKAYKEMLSKLHTEVGSGQITAVNEAVKLNKLVQILCLKYDTNVLTDRGWIEIQSVLPSDRVWDGVEWVGHGGVVFNGVRQVVDCAGVWCTEDHLVLSSCGWVTAKEFINGNASKRLDWAEVRLPGGCEPGGIKKGRQELRGDVELLVHLRKHGGSSESVPANETQDAPSELWVSPRQRKAQVVEHDATPHMVWGQGEVSHANQPGLAKLRWAWDFYVRQVAGVVHEFFGRHGWLVPRGADIGADGQRRPLLPRELPVGDAGRAVQQQAHKHLGGYRAWSDDNIPSGSGVRSAGDNTSGASAQVQVASGESSEYPCEAVYDITNCGPRNQFVVLGTDGQARIVHNCGVAYGGPDEENIEIPAGPRVDLVREVIEQAESKVIVFVPLTGALTMLARELAKDFTVEVIHGGTSKSDRDRIFKDFQNAKDPRVLVANPGAMSHGITLTAANTTIWYAPTTSNETWNQANARTVRPGQKLKTFIVQIEGSDIERKMYERLQNKTRVQGLLLDLVRDAR